MPQVVCCRHSSRSACYPQNIWVLINKPVGPDLGCFESFEMTGQLTGAFAEGSHRAKTASAPGVPLLPNDPSVQVTTGDPTVVIHLQRIQAHNVKFEKPATRTEVLRQL